MAVLSFVGAAKRDVAVPAWSAGPVVRVPLWKLGCCPAAYVALMLRTSYGPGFIADHARAISLPLFLRHAA